jgi:hypothetical protein
MSGDTVYLSFRLRRTPLPEQRPDAAERGGGDGRGGIREAMPRAPRPQLPLLRGVRPDGAVPEGGLRVEVPGGNGRLVVAPPPHLDDEVFTAAVSGGSGAVEAEPLVAGGRYDEPAVAVDEGRRIAAVVADERGRDLAQRRFAQRYLGVAEAGARRRGGGVPIHPRDVARELQLAGQHQDLAPELVASRPAPRALLRALLGADYGRAGLRRADRDE